MFKHLAISLYFGLHLSLAWATTITPSTPTHAQDTPPEQPALSIRFGTDATYPPLVSLTPDREVSGFETEVLKAVCQEQKLDCHFVHIEWDNLIPALKAGKIDAIYGGVAITPQRKQQFVFSDIINDHNLTGFIARHAAHFSFTPEGLKDKQLGVQTGTAFTQYLQTFEGLEVKRYVSLQDALLDLNATRLDAVMGDTPVLHYFLKSLSPETQAFYEIHNIVPSPESLDILGEGYGIGFMPGPNTHQRLDKLNRGLQQFKAEPAYQSLKQTFDIP